MEFHCEILKSKTFFKNLKIKVENQILCIYMLNRDIVMFWCLCVA